ncbi:RecB family nuclease [Paenibacillus sp. TCA20]|uniref:Uncharacterized protein n=1 Tax=Paenibacillus urinalis TaxID=521520 RepID=A0ABY7XH27_9BACL|nr:MULTISPECIES: hypothetical protein [Paenibacillus]WDI05088.1 hypothetical protein PUW25_26320 [Paenibacillus urinalis]GAK42085.1 RecB family nuclease [Paenibacillus sp. TCA20]
MLTSVRKALEYLAITPAVVQLVFTLVALFETEGNGAEKKQAVLDTVRVVYAEVNGVFALKVSESFVLRVAGSTVDIVVSFHNLVGTFKKKEA